MKLTWLIGLLVLAGCVTAPVTEPDTQAPTKDFNYEIDKIVNTSACAAYSWKNRGVGPKAYFSAIAKAYHKEFCANKPETTPGSSDFDALTWYGLTPNLKNTYVLLTGLGMRESSGKFCTGKDASASNTSAETAEAGPFQSSYNSRYKPVVKNGVTSYVVDESRTAIYKLFEACPITECKGSQAKNWGTGEGVEFQRRSKECPAFAVEYNALMIRLNRRHYGPINRKEAEFIPACGIMLDQVAALGC